VSCVHLSPDALPWTEGAHPLERKKASAERPMLLIELAPGFVDPNTCLRSHVIYVLSGALSLELDDRLEHVGEGQACWLDAGTTHRARNDGQIPVVAFIASDMEQPR
jgi:mannose-6-phosphate isomerase-like protein (cupin superfamily)